MDFLGLFLRDLESLLIVKIIIEAIMYQKKIFAIKLKKPSGLLKPHLSQSLCGPGFEVSMQGLISKHSLN